MTRQEQLSFCSKCNNRKFDPNQGIICKITDKPADFINTCELFEKDDSIKEVIQEEEKTLLAATDVAAFDLLPKEILHVLKSHQSIGFAVLGGFLMAIFSSLLWAAITVATQYQIGYMAIAVGLMVGFTVRFFGAGIDKTFGYIGAGFALLGCLMGNFFSQIGFYANDENLPYLEVLGYINSSNLMEVMTASFSPMDLVFYTIAIYQGYRFSFRNVPESISDAKELAPFGAKARFPLAIITSVVIGIFLFTVSSAGNMDKDTYYESGKIYSKGKLSDGLKDGYWQFFHENGNVGAEGNYLEGKESGEWKYYNENGNLVSIENFEGGNLHGKFLGYGESESLVDSATYVYGRLDGLSISRFPDGTIRSKGNYHLDLPTGAWEYYHANGKMSEQGEFKDGLKTGLWKSWHEHGQEKDILIYSEGEISEWIYYMDESGNKQIENKNGTYTAKYEDGKVSLQGKIVNGKMDGIWKTYHPDGKPDSELTYENGQSKLANHWDKEGKQLIQNGTGDYISLTESGSKFEEGKYINGLKHGNWKVYFDEDETMLNQTNYNYGKMDGYMINYFPNEQEALKGYFSNDLKHGKWIWYYEDGSIETEVEYVKDKKTGSQKFYNTEGFLVKTEVYEDGILKETILE
jgi:antitoxin component YwqK of YwqJK toxin-antitoxin module